MVAALIASGHIFSTIAPEYVYNYAVDIIRLTAYNVKKIYRKDAEPMICEVYHKFIGSALEKDI